MSEHKIDRRTVLKATAALAAGGFLPAFAQSGAGPSVPALPARGEFVIRGAIVLTMDEQSGDFAGGDVHVKDGVIVAVAKEIAAPASAAVIDARGMICMPGFIDSHIHLWASALRSVVRADDPKLGYFPVTNRLGPHYTPEDSYRHVRVGLAEALAAGATTVHNWSHNVPTPEHADAELRAMRDAGLRGRYSYGAPLGLPNDKPMDLEGLAQIQSRWMPNDGMLTLGINSRNAGTDPNPLRGNIPLEIIKADWGGARKLGLPIALHTAGPSPIKMLDDAGLLGPDVQLAHPLLSTPEDRKILKARGVSYSIAAVAEARRSSSLGVIQLAEMLEAGVKISLSVDTSANYSCDYFGGMRMLYSLHQHRVGSRVPLTMKRLVQLATLDGAVDLGFADRTGSLTPGKRADLILVRTTDTNLAPIGDPYEALVGYAQPHNVDTVVADGRVLYRANRFTALDHAAVVKAGMESVAGLRARAGWP